MIELDALQTLNLAILVLFAGKFLNSRIEFLRKYNIPEPVSGGLPVCLLTWAIFALSGKGISFDLGARDVLLVYFFAGIGLNSDFRTLLKGGLPLLILLGATIGYMFIQNFTGVGMANLLGMDSSVGVLSGTTSLIGGHGTAIAWTPVFQERFGITNASEIGIASATFGLVLSSLMGGPIANLLITKHQLEPKVVEQPDVGVVHEQQQTSINLYSMLMAWLALNLSIGLGSLIQEGLEATGIKQLELPLFVCCLFGGIILTNAVPRLMPRVQWPQGSRSLALISDLALGMFLAMSLMSLQLWTLAGVAGPILGIVGAQFVVAFLFALFVVFRLMGRDYEAAVICSGFGGISLGATPTAMANMTAVTNRYGAAHKAFIIVPLVCGFFVDIANAFIINLFLDWFG
ncbi:sodium/glutamate symporter [Haloferula rosea]|uniref:Sodium/glutamate symporter n=1 Tax=Haloferula rosea TaxID=490093 RepID=A0A934RI92_9BACT|nr:sodium/glutamate symporter [Haloferula rosea]MBK1828780.1 sodium/glutamate symporter [Haloferula rosea]